GQTYQLTVTSTVTASSGSVSNTATITAEGRTTELPSRSDSACDPEPVNTVADLSITKSDGVASVSAGGSTSYTVTVSNAGPSSVVAAVLLHLVELDLTNRAIMSPRAPVLSFPHPPPPHPKPPSPPRRPPARGQTYQLPVPPPVTASSGSVSTPATI